MTAANPRNRLIVILAVVVVAALGWGATQWGPFASSAAEPEKAEPPKSAAAVAALEKMKPAMAKPQNAETQKAEMPVAEACDVVLRGTKAEIVGHPDAVVFKAMGPAVQLLSVKSADKATVAKFTELKIKGGKAISVAKPSGKFDLIVQARSMTPVQLAAEARCPAG